MTNRLRPLPAGNPVGMDLANPWGSPHPPQRRTPQNWANPNLPTPRQCVGLHRFVAGVHCRSTKHSGCDSSFQAVTWRGAPCRTDQWNTAYRRVDGVAEAGPNRNRVEQSAIGAAEPAGSEVGQVVTGTTVEVLTK